MARNRNVEPPLHPELARISMLSSNLRAQAQNGVISDAEAQQGVAGLVAYDGAGTEWRIHPVTGQWHRRLPNGQLVVADPYTAVAGQQFARPDELAGSLMTGLETRNAESYTPVSEHKRGAWFTMRARWQQGLIIAAGLLVIIIAVGVLQGSGDNKIVKPKKTTTTTTKPVDATRVVTQGLAAVATTSANVNFHGEKPSAGATSLLSGAGPVSYVGQLRVANFTGTGEFVPIVGNPPLIVVVDHADVYARGGQFHTALRQENASWYKLEGVTLTGAIHPAAYAGLVADTGLSWASGARGLASKGVEGVTGVLATRYDFTSIDAASFDAPHQAALLATLAPFGITDAAGLDATGSIYVDTQGRAIAITILAKNNTKFTWAYTDIASMAAVASPVKFGVRTLRVGQPGTAP